MPRAPKQCGHLDCTERVIARTYCPTHEADRQTRMAAKRGRTAARGYDGDHQQEREAWRPAVDAGRVACWRCLRIITPGQPWDVGHDDNDRTITRGPEHRHCNRQAGAAQAYHHPADA